jgi:diguanylate cyclase (GGDEF)-like protein
VGGDSGTPGGASLARLGTGGSPAWRRFALLLAAAGLVVAALVWAVGQVAETREEQRADGRLAGLLAVAHTRFSDEVAEAERTAARLAESPAVQRALADRDRAALARIARANPGAVFVAGGESLAGRRPARAVWRTVDVLGDGRTLGRVEVALPLDRSLVARLGRGTALEPGDRFTLAVDGRPVDGSGAAPRAGGASEVEVGGEAYRALGIRLLGREPPATLAALTPRSRIDGEVGRTRRRVLVGSFAALATLLALGLLANALLGRPPLGRERRRDLGPPPHVRHAVELVGNALAAANDRAALRPVILETALQATGAAGALLVEDGVEVSRAGDVAGGGEPLVLGLEDGDGAPRTTLELFPPLGGFDRDARELARLLATQASVALENARLHGIAKREAATDELTGLANRRRFVGELELELSRAERFGGPVALVLADLDNFKQVNDRYGHEVGDDVLRAFARVLSGQLREVDLPGRIGGDEFAVLLRETDLPGGIALAERLRAGLARVRVETPRGPLRVTASLGVTAYGEARTSDELFAEADEALYAAKAGGRDRVVARPGGP